MKVVDEELLEEFRCARKCEWCGKSTPGGCDPHHLWARGMGGGGRLDIRVNLMSLCRSCHNDVHLGHVLREHLLMIVARREGRTQDQIRAEIYKLRRTR